MPRVGEALRAARAAGRPSVVAYAMADRGRARVWPRWVEALRRSGTTALEVGLPFSDPIADGPVLQAAADRALAHGTDWSDGLRAVRLAARSMPVAVMTYANRLWARGLPRAFSDLAAAGASAVIVADLSLEEADPWRAVAGRAGIDLVLLGAPHADTRRIAAIARASRGFLYLISRYGTTGQGATEGGAALARLVAAARAHAPRLPILLGFGVRDPTTARAALRSGADGVILGSALEEDWARDASGGRAVARLARLARAIGAVPSGGRTAAAPVRPLPVGARGLRSR